jgi:hypothetical protein
VREVQQLQHFPQQNNNNNSNINAVVTDSVAVVVISNSVDEAAIVGVDDV